LTQVGIDDLKHQLVELKGLMMGGVKKSHPLMSQNQVAIQELCQQVKRLKKDSLEQEKDLYCDSLENIFLEVESIIMEKVQMCASFVRWLTESKTCKEKIES
jgi:serine/threonine protein phosphatase PrpC